MNNRMRFNTANASAAGETDARSLLVALNNAEEGDNMASLLNDSLAEIIGLAVESRIEECTARLEAFCSVLGPVLHAASTSSKQLDALRAKCALLSASLAQDQTRSVAQGKNTRFAEQIRQAADLVEADTQDIYTTWVSIIRFGGLVQLIDCDGLSPVRWPQKGGKS